MPERVVTIERHIIDEERRHPQATGAFSNILYDLAFAGKVISREVNKAGLVDILGEAGATNVHGELVKKLDMFAHDVIFRALDHCGHLCCMASEEAEDFLRIPDKFPTGPYVLIFDPLDGSSNIEANVSIGTIFSLMRRVSGADRGALEDFLQPGYKQVAAGYIVYGSSTMMVYTTGHGVHGFTLDPTIGEFLLSHRDMKIPSPGKRIYSVNEGYYTRWSAGPRRLVDRLKGVDGSGSKPYALRYIGSMVSDVHRTLLYGGIFMYPAQRDRPDGKLRLLYEANPMALLFEAAGGMASDGHGRLLDKVPTSLHERTPVYLGDTELVQLAERFLAEHDGEQEDDDEAPELAASMD